MRFRVENALPEDAPALGEIMMEVSTGPRVVLAFKDCKREDWLGYYVEGIYAELARYADHSEEAVVSKAVDQETGEIAGFSVWGWSARAADAIIHENNRSGLPAGANTSLLRTFASRLKKLEDEHRPKGAFYELCELNISPRYQRQGLGSLLVKKGLDKADRDGVMCFLSASPMGVAVYRKLGFVDVGKLEMDLEEFGGETSHVHLAMIRNPVVATIS